MRALWSIVGEFIVVNESNFRSSGTMKPVTNDLTNNLTTEKQGEIGRLQSLTNRRSRNEVNLGPKNVYR